MSRNCDAADRKVAPLAWLIAFAVLLTAGQSWGAEPAADARASDNPPMLLDEMNGARPVLALLDPTPGVGILRQAIDQGGEHFGEAEHLTLAIPPGASAHLAYGIRKAPVIEELKLEAWVWCSRPGIQLGAVLVLPRSIDPATGEPRRLVLRSGVTAEAGNWQRIVMEDVPTLRDRQIRVARATYGPNLAEAESYLSHIVIIAPGGSGATDVWVDKISLYGVVEPRSGSMPTAEPALAELAQAWTASTGVTPASAVYTPRRAPPAMPRVIQWQGEPLETLAQLGFDAVGMGRLPGAAELAEAERLGLWLVCPPPSIETLETTGVGAEYDGVLAWDLGDLDDAAAIELAAEWSRALERHERQPTRPTIVRSSTHPREASRVGDILLLGRPSVGATATWLEQAAWLGHARQLGRPGTVVWAGLDTQRSPATLTQLAVLRGSRIGSGAASYEHLARAATAALGASPRGFWFTSHASLAAQDRETRRRALALELANLRLGMIEPWLAGGKPATPAKSSAGDALTAMVLTVERSHLVIPMRWSAKSGEPAPGSVFVGAARPASQEVSFVLPGVPEACDAYLLTIAGPRQLVTRRVTGGLSVTVERLPDDAFLLLTEDTFALSQVERYLRRFAPRAAQARVELAQLQRDEAAAAAQRLPSGLLQSADAAGALAGVDAALAATRRTLDSQDYAAAFARAELVDAALATLRERLFVNMWPDGQAGASPVRGDWDSLPDLERVARISASAAPVPATVAGGDFESLSQVLEAGWRRSDDTQHGVAGAVRLSADNPHSGAYCLELEAVATGDGAMAPVLATPPVWITSPPLTVPAGHVVEISGWARVSETPLGSADPLLIFDSVGGEESAIRIDSTTAWERFRLVRAVPAGTECRVTIALGGVGRASVDAMQYRLLPLPMAGPIALR